jgi:hypothetical protein
VFFTAEVTNGAGQTVVTYTPVAIGAAKDPTEQYYTLAFAEDDYIAQIVKAGDAIEFGTLYRRSADASSKYSYVTVAGGKLNGVPVINVLAEAGFGYARVKTRKYQLDNIHLNKLGGKNMGNFIWSKLKDIPLWEAE